jgi:hypothetical protein
MDLIFKSKMEKDDIKEEINSNHDDTDNLGISGNNIPNANNQTDPHRGTFISESMGGITVS